MYLKIWNNQCHSTGVKKSYFGHAFHLTPKKSFLVGGGGGLWVKSDFSVSLRPFFQRSEIEMDTELNNNSRNTFCADHWS